MVKCTINDVKTGKSYSKETDSTAFLNKKLGEKVSGSNLGLPGYELEIVGASDTAGFPHRKDIEGIGRKAIITPRGFGARGIPKGVVARKLYRGNTLSEFTAQVNLKIAGYGSKPVEELLGVQKKEEAAPAPA